ncbi:hypothetical protein BASA81_002638 [Batrachochytrium salamandrivorans]|nr:hypothetical protein BASA81_002638 [Batrachochytrium salamandrivorans]
MSWIISFASLSLSDSIVAPSVDLGFRVTLGVSCLAWSKSLANTASTVGSSFLSQFSMASAWSVALSMSRTTCSRASMPWSTLSLAKGGYLEDPNVRCASSLASLSTAKVFFHPVLLDHAQHHHLFQYQQRQHLAGHGSPSQYGRDVKKGSGLGWTRKKMAAGKPHPATQLRQGSSLCAPQQQPHCGSPLGDVEVRFGSQG